MSERELGYFFVAKTTLWLQATPEQRACLQGRYPAYDLDSALLPVTSGLFSRMRCAIVQEEQQSRK